MSEKDNLPQKVDECLVEAGLNKLRSRDDGTTVQVSAKGENGMPIALHGFLAEDAKEAVLHLLLAEEKAIAMAHGERAAAMQTTRSAFRWIGALVPKRIRDEEIGDALEDIAKIISDPSRRHVRWAVRWKIISTWFWLLWHAVGRISAAIRGKKAS